MKDLHAKNPRDIIIRPVVSEKSYALLDTNVYTFVVHPDASKPEIHDAVESIFGVKVLKVNTLNRNGKRKRKAAELGRPRTTSCSNKHNAAPKSSKWLRTVNK